LFFLKATPQYCFIFFFVPFTEESRNHAELILLTGILFTILYQQERNIQSSEKFSNPFKNRRIESCKNRYPNPYKNLPNPSKNQALILTGTFVCQYPNPLKP